MIPQSSDTTSAAAAQGPASILRKRLPRIRRPRWPVVLCGVLVVAAVAVALVVAYDNGAFARGPAVDAATAYVTDLRSRESEQSYAAQMRAIDASDGQITGVTVVAQQTDGNTTVVQLTITRASRGAFSAHFAVKETNGAWLITANDDL